MPRPRHSGVLQGEALSLGRRFPFFELNTGEVGYRGHQHFDEAFEDVIGDNEAPEKLFAKDAKRGGD
jgi:hypothetical protein